MAKIQRVAKSRKEWKCGKCGKVIAVGDPYLYAEPAFRPRIVRCTDCGLKPYETSSSEYIQTIGALQDNWIRDYGTGDDAVEGIKDALQELMDTAQDSFDNMPEQLQDSDSGMTLQERIDSLESAIDDLDNIDIDEIIDEVINDTPAVTVSVADLKDYYKDDLSCLETYIDMPDEDEEKEDDEEEVDDDKEVDLDLSSLPNNESYDEILELPYISDDVKSDLATSIEERITDAIDEALSNL